MADKWKTKPFVPMFVGPFILFLPNNSTKQFQRALGHSVYKIINYYYLLFKKENLYFHRDQKTVIFGFT